MTAFAHDLQAHPAATPAPRPMAGGDAVPASSSRLAGLAGVLFVGLALGSAAVQGRPPSYAEDGPTVAAWFARNSTTYLAGQVLSGLGFLLFYVPFLVGLTERLRAAEGPHPFWSQAAWAGGLLFPAAGVVGGVFPVGLALLGGAVSPDVASLAVAAGAFGLGVSGALGAVLLGPAAVVIIQTGTLWRWVGWSGALVAAAAVAGSAAVLERNPAGALATLGDLAWLGLFAWMLAASVALLQR